MLEAYEVKKIEVTVIDENIFAHADMEERQRIPGITFNAT